jgi:hypothetical protein
VSARQAVAGATSVCRTANHKLSSALNTCGDNPSADQILEGFFAEGRAFGWESRAFASLPAATSTQHRVFHYMSSFYKYAGKETNLGAQEDQLGNTDQGEIDLDNATHDAQDAAQVAHELGIHTCDGQ